MAIRTREAGLRASAEAIEGVAAGDIPIAEFDDLTEGKALR